jgi:hyperosmotically inducible protein
MSLVGFESTRAWFKNMVAFQIFLIVGFTTFIGWHGAAVAATETQNPDQMITEAVENALLVDESVPSHFIDVETQHGIVTLVGNVPHYRAKQRAAQLVETVKGVESVVNGLTVKKSQRPDEDILQDVQRVLHDDPVTGSYEVTATIQDGVVALSGTVPSWAAKELTAWVASGVLGVRGIENSLIQKLTEQRQDSTILEEIQKRLKADVWVNHESVLLSVKDGVVSLNGVVGSVAEKRRVIRDAHVAGVKKVDERLLFVKKWAQGAE